MLALLALAVAATHHAQRTDGSPLLPDGAWRYAWTLGVLGAFAAYLGGLALLRRGTPRTALVLGLAAAIQLVTLAAPLLLSKDTYAYWGYGRVGAVQGENPYAVPPSEFPLDEAHDRIGADWVDTTSLYGPVFTAVSEAHAAAAGDSPSLATWLYRLLGALAVVGIALLAAVAAPRPALAAAFVGWNPLLALHFGGGGHNDALMMVFVLGALALAARGRGALAGASWAVAVAVKWMPLVLLPLWLLAAAAALRRRALLGLAAAAAVLAALASLRYGGAWLGVFAAGSEDATWTGSISLPFKLRELGVPLRVAIAGLGLAYALVWLWLALQAWRGRPRLALAAGLLALTSAWLVPWYAVWAVPLAAVEEDRLGRALALGLSAYLLLDAVPL